MMEASSSASAAAAALGPARLQWHNPHMCNVKAYHHGRNTPAAISSSSSNEHLLKQCF